VQRTLTLPASSMADWWGCGSRCTELDCLGEVMKSDKLRNLPVRDDAVALAIRALSSKSPVVTIPKVSAISLN